MFYDVLHSHVTSAVISELYSIEPAAVALSARSIDLLQPLHVSMFRSSKQFFWREFLQRFVFLNAKTESHSKLNDFSLGNAIFDGFRMSVAPSNIISVFMSSTCSH